MLTILDISLEIVHISIILIIVLGWCFKKTRRINLVIILITAFSWFGAGWFYGFGYCFITDYHFYIKNELGIYNLPLSYIKYLVDRVFSIDSNPFFIDILTMSLFVFSFIISLILNLKSFFQREKNEK